MRRNAPCKDCRFKYAACHDSCELYKEFMDYKEAVKKAKRAEKNLYDKRRDFGGTKQECKR